MIILIHWRGRESRPHSAIATTHPLRFSGGRGRSKAQQPYQHEGLFQQPLPMASGLPGFFKQPFRGVGPSKHPSTTPLRWLWAFPPRQGPFNQPFRCNSVFWFWPAPAELWCRKVWLKGKLGPKHSVQRTLPHSYFSSSFYKSAVFIKENGFAKPLEETGFKDTPDKGSANISPPCCEGRNPKRSAPHPTW